MRIQEVYRKNTTENKIKIFIRPRPEYHSRYIGTMNLQVGKDKICSKTLRKFSTFIDQSRVWDRYILPLNSSGPFEMPEPKLDFRHKFLFSSAFRISFERELRNLKGQVTFLKLLLLKQSKALNNSRFPLLCLNSIFMPKKINALASACRNC